MISAVVLTTSNSRSLLKTIESLAWADEIIIVVDGQTRPKFNNKKINVFSRVLASDFAAQRNFGMKKANGDWVLFVDDDEIISNKLANEILNINSNVNGYFIRRLDYMWGKPLLHGETGNIKLLRMAKKNAGQWAQSVHEVWNINGETGELENPILHYPHPTVADFLDNINTYSTLYATYLFDRGVKEPWWRIVCNPVGKFLQNYILRLGFLDGTAGVIVAIMMSFHSFLTRSKLWKLRH